MKLHPAGLLLFALFVLGLLVLANASLSVRIAVGAAAALFVVEGLSVWHTLFKSRQRRLDC
jgi:hypothetical protein